jgi:RNA polymerase sigma-70 factor (ECF subfamily)
MRTDGTPADRVWRERGLRDAVLAGDPAAWQTLYDDAFEDLYAYVSWRCGGLRDPAEDVVQQTWLTAVRRLADFDPARASFRQWLAGIAAHVLRNHWRKQRRRPAPGLNGTAEPADAEAQRRERAEGVARALAELPERYEAVLRARYLDQRSVADIAAAWGETPKAVESLLSRARQAFREAYHPGETP